MNFKGNLTQFVVPITPAITGSIPVQLTLPTRQCAYNCTH